MMMTPQIPPHCPGVIQRLCHRAEAIGHTEYLRTIDAPHEWTRDPLEAYIFHDDGQPGGKTGYELADRAAKRLQEVLAAELGDDTLLPAVRSVRRPPQDPPMPRGFFSNGRRDRLAREETERLRRQDWREGVPNAGID